MTLTDVGELFLRAGLCSLTVSTLAWAFQFNAKHMKRHRRWWM